MPTPPSDQHRPIRSFVRRAGRLTAGQAQALTTLWPTLGLSPSVGRLLDLNAVFGRDAPKILEIGFGNGDSLAHMAANEPQHDFLGVEVHRPGIGHLMLRTAQLQLRNVRVVPMDAVELLRHHIGANAFSGVQIYFPDPWQKKRHHKRRLIQAPFLSRLARHCRAGAFVHLATDWEDYARHMLDTVNASPHWRNAAADRGFSPRPARRPQTKFERRGQRLGHDVWDLLAIHCDT